MVMGLYQQVAIAVLAGAVAVFAAVVDVRERRIPNRLTYASMVIGLAAQTALFGWRGLLSSLAGGLVAGGILSAFYLIRSMGAGDVKLAAALGCIVGWPASLQMLTATALAGGVLAVIFMLAKRRVGETLRNTLSVVKHHAVYRLGVHPTVNLDNPKAARMPYGLAFAAGTIYWAVSALFLR
jgi:prepilin peptidase CpaA